jgi:histidine triad (HIT) family protein
VTSENGCEFCQLIRRMPEGVWVMQAETCVAFLDHRPLFLGHTLVVPREHHETLLDLPPKLVGPLFAEVRRVARAVQEAMQAEGTFVAVNNHVSQSVPHLHVHVVPRRPKDGLRGFFWPRRSYRDESEQGEVQTKIREALARTAL